MKYSNTIQPSLGDVDDALSQALIVQFTVFAYVLEKKLLSIFITAVINFYY